MCLQCGAGQWEGGRTWDKAGGEEKEVTRGLTMQSRIWRL